MRRQRQHSVRAAWLMAGAALALGATVRAQELATVAVDDSPTATQLLAQARDQAGANAAESARLIRRVLGEFGRKLVPLPDDPDRFMDARACAEQLLRANPEVLRRWRAIESAEARRQLDAGGAEGTVEERFLTPAGLDAQLALAQEELSHARFAKALQRIDSLRGHPDLAAGQARRALQVECLAAWGAGDSARAKSALEAVGRMEGIEAADAARALTATLAVPAPQAAAVNDPLGPQPFGDLERAPTRLWTEALEDTARRRERMASGVRGIPSAAEGAEGAGAYLASVPTISGGRVLVNEGFQLHAFDPLTRELAWTASLGGHSGAREGQPGDLAAPVVCDGRVLALSGHATASDRGEGGRLLCLDARDGRRRLWEFVPTRHSRMGLEDTFIVGSPAVIDGTVLVLLRRVSGRQETVTFAAGISLADGSLLWVTPLGATPGIRIAPGGIRPCATPLALGDSFVVSTGAGVTARIGAADGRVMWLRRDQVPVRDARWELKAWQLQRPVACAAGIALVDPDQQHVQVLDPADGRQLSRVPIGIGTAWGDTRWLLGSADGGSVIGVGDSVVCMDARDMRTPRWSTRAGGDPAVPVVGRVQAGMLPDGRGAVAIPQGDRVVVREMLSGSIICEMPAPGPCNPSLHEGLAALASEDTLTVLVDSVRTERLLASEAAAGSPTALAGLLEFALASSRADLARSASRQASAWLPPAGGDAAGNELAERIAALLIDIACSGMLEASESGALFERVISREADPSRQAHALLAQGDWLERSGRVDAAVAVWRRVCMDAALRMAWVVPEDPESAVVRAGITAAQRLARARVAHPRAPVCTPSGAVPPAGAPALALVAFAQANPCSGDAARAWSLAAARAAAEGDAPSAAAWSWNALEDAIACRDPAPVAEVLERALDALDRVQLPDASAMLLDLAVRSGFDMPLSSRRDRTPSMLLAASPSQRVVLGEPRPPAASAAREGRMLRGEPIAMSPRARLTRPTGVMWMADRTGVACISVQDMQPVWRIPLVGASPALLHASERGSVIWEPRLGDRIALSMVTQAGERAWSIADLDAEVRGVDPEAGGPEEEAARLIAPDGGLTLPGVLPGPGDIVLVRRDGTVASVDVASGSVRWRMTKALAEVVDADADDSVVILAGRKGGAEAGAMSIVVIDRARGTVCRTLDEESGSDIAWIRVIAPGQVAIGRDGSLSRWDALQGQVSWIQEDAWGRGASAVMPCGALLAVREEGFGCRGVRWSDGALEPAAFARLSPSNAVPTRWSEMARSGDAILAADESGAFLFDLQGRLLGATAPMPGRSLQGATPMGPGLVTCEQQASMTPGAIGQRARSTARLQLLGWSDGLRMQSLPVTVDLSAPVLGMPIAVDGWLMLHVGKEATCAVPVPAS